MLESDETLKLPGRELADGGAKVISFEDGQTPEQRRTQGKAILRDHGQESTSKLNADEAAHVQRAQKLMNHHQSKYAINPEKHRTFRGVPLLGYWDVYMLFLLIVVSFITPYEVAFMHSEQPLWFIFLNRLVDVSFLGDMVLQFFMMYRDPKTNALVGQLGRITKHYLRGWFIIDFMSIFPFAEVAEAATSKEEASAAAAESELGRMNAIQMVRLLRVLKLIRIMKISRLLQRWQQSVDQVNFLVVTLCKDSAILVASSHWVACLLGLVLEMEEMRVYTLRTRVEETYENGDRMGPWSLYVACLYWAVMTLTSIGYGDIVPVNDEERVVCVVIMLLGSCIFAYVVGSICGICATLGEEESDFKNGLEKLNQLMQLKKLPRALKNRLRGFYYSSRSLRRESRMRDVYDLLSPALLGELVLASDSAWVTKVWWLRGTTREFVVVLSKALRILAIAPKEVFGYPSTMYVLDKGVVSYQKRVLLTGDTWGDDDMLLFSPLMLAQHRPAYSLTFSQVQSLPRTAIEDACESYPANSPTIRMVYRLQVFRAMVKFLARASQSFQGKADKFEVAEHMIDRQGVCEADFKAFSELGRAMSLADFGESEALYRPPTVDEVIGQMGHKGPRPIGGYGLPEDYVTEDFVDEHTLAIDGRTAGMDERLRRLEAMMHVLHDGMHRLLERGGGSVSDPTTSPEQRFGLGAKSPGGPGPIYRPPRALPPGADADAKCFNGCAGGGPSGTPI